MGKGPGSEPEDQRLFHFLAELPGLRWARLLGDGGLKHDFHSIPVNRLWWRGGDQQEHGIRCRNNRGLIWQQSGGKIVPTDLWTDDKIEVEGKENRRI